jgi:hypothetical protein
LTKRANPAGKQPESRSHAGGGAELRKSARSADARAGTTNRDTCPARLPSFRIPRGRGPPAWIIHVESEHCRARVLPEQRKRTRRTLVICLRRTRRKATEVPAETAFARSALQIHE